MVPRAPAEVLHRYPTILRVSHKEKHTSLAASVFPYTQRGFFEEAQSLKCIALKFKSEKGVVCYLIMRMSNEF